MCWYVMLCASTKCRKFEHVKVCTSIYWYMLHTFLSMTFISFHTASYPYFLIPPHTKYENLRKLHTWYETVCTSSYQNTDFRRVAKYIPVCTGMYRYILLQAMWSGFQMCLVFPQPEVTTGIVASISAVRSTFLEKPQSWSDTCNKLYDSEKIMCIIVRTTHSSSFPFFICALLHLEPCAT